MRKPKSGSAVLQYELILFNWDLIHLISVTERDGRMTVGLLLRLVKHLFASVWLY